MSANNLIIKVYWPLPERITHTFVNRTLLINYINSKLGNNSSLQSIKNDTTFKNLTSLYGKRFKNTYVMKVSALNRTLTVNITWPKSVVTFNFKNRTL
jgi:hypothetical protein